MKQNIKTLNKDSISNSVKPSHTGAEAKRKINTDPVYLKFDFFPSWIIFFASDSIFSKYCITMLLVSITEFSGASWNSAPEASLSSALLLCLTLLDPVDCSPPGSSIHGILQATILEQVVRPSSRWSSQPRDQTSVSYTACNGQVVLFYLAPAGKPPAQSWWAVNLVHYSIKGGMDNSRNKPLAKQNHTNVLRLQAFQCFLSQEQEMLQCEEPFCSNYHYLQLQSSMNSSHTYPFCREEHSVRI